MSAKDKITKLVREHVRADMPDEIKRLAAYAYADLHFGPSHNDLEEDPAFSFEEATGKLSAWVSDNVPSSLWVDLDCEMVSPSAPEGYYDGDEWIEPYTNDTYQLERAEIKRAAFGDLADYL